MNETNEILKNKGNMIITSQKFYLYVDNKNQPLNDINILCGHIFEFKQISPELLYILKPACDCSLSWALSHTFTFDP